MQGQSWDRQVELWFRKQGADEYKINKAIEPYAKGAALMVPSLSLISSGKTLITGSDIYENKTDAIDYGLSIIDIVTFGTSNFLKLSKTSEKVNTIIDWTGTGGSAGKTTIMEIINKKNEKKKK